MIGMCPYVCNNKSQSGYCRTTACVNPLHKGGIDGANYSSRLYKSLQVYKPKDGEKKMTCGKAGMKEEYWIFTFGVGQKHEGRYVKIKGTFEESRQKMVDKYGLDWCFQYSEEDWEKWKVDPKRWWPMETELEVIE